MRTRGEVEAAISDGITRFEQEYMGRGPKHIRTHLIGDLLVVRLQGVLTAAEQQLVKTATPEKGRDLLKQVRTHLVGDLLVVRLQGVLTAAEQQLVKTLPAEKGRDLLKQVRTHLIEAARPVLEAMIQDITGVSPTSLHHDISTVAGEEVVLFTLAESPRVRESRTKR